MRGNTDKNPNPCLVQVAMKVKVSMAVLCFRDHSRLSDSRESKRRKDSLSEANDEALKKKLKEEEDARLDEEIQKRRKRVEMWQAQRRKEADEKAADEDEEGEGVRKWTLEDDDDDEDEDADMKESGDAVKVKYWSCLHIIC